MRLNRNTNARNSPNEFGAPLAHDSIRTGFHCVEARSDRFLHRRNLGQPDAECHERIRSGFANRDGAGRIPGIKFNFKRIDSSLLRCRCLARRKGHRLRENRLSLQALKVLDGVIASAIFPTQRHDPVQPTRVSISRR